MFSPELPRNHPCQEGLQLIHSNPSNRSDLTEMNSNAVKTMKNPHEVIDVHGTSSELLGFETTEDFCDQCFYIEIHWHILKCYQFYIKNEES